jgi:hypothetical protein
LVNIYYYKKEGLIMKKIKKNIVLLLTISLIMGSLYSIGWAEDKSAKENPLVHEWNVLDLVFARPIGVAAGIFGSALFVVSLPFTIPSGGVDEALEMFIVKPFQFSFTREFPDEDI